jgi:SAM-dependent methyltransferase
MWSENELKFFPVKRQQRLAFRRLAVPRLQGRVADLGAGSGPYHREIPSCNIVALDQVVSPVIQVLGSVTALPFKAASFDGVILSETLEHVPRPQLALAEVVRTLQPHGWLYLTTPQMWPLHYEPHDYFRFTRYGLTYLLEEAGLREVTLQPLGGLYTYLFTRLGEKFIKLLVNLLGWLPRPQRWFVAGVLGLPLQYLFYLLSFWLDRLAPKDVLGWAVVARKGPGRLDPSSPKK